MSVLAITLECGLLHVLQVDSDNPLLGACDAPDGLRALLAAGNCEAVLLRNRVTGFDYQ